MISRHTTGREGCTGHILVALLDPQNPKIGSDKIIGLEARYYPSLSAGAL